MQKWLELSDERKAVIIQQASQKTGLPAMAIEKDWWVTVVLRAIFSTRYKDDIVFKGGTSLSKGWNLIERFSEDIDIGINKRIVDEKYEGDINKGQIKALRAAAARFICNELSGEIKNALQGLGVGANLYTMTIPELKGAYSDPMQLEINYKTVVGENNEYLLPRILIECTARSGHEPCSNRDIQSILKTTFPDVISEDNFAVPVIAPRRTFLEKALLLHEEFLKPKERIRSARMSRHLYDLVRIMDTEHGVEAVGSPALYATIIAHREKYTPIPGIDYAGHAPERINFIPPQDVIKDWESDYETMRREMIYGDAPTFEELMKNVNTLQERFRLIKMQAVAVDIEKRA